MGGVASAFFDLLTRGRLIEYPIGRKPRMKTYKHVAVPPGVDRNLEVLRAAVTEEVRGCIFSVTSSPLVGKAGCSSIACSNCICHQGHRDLLKEYLNKAEKESSTEEQIKAVLKPGMVLRTRAGSFFLWVGGPNEEAYRLEHVNGCVALESCDSLLGWYDDVDAVYAYHNRITPAVAVCSLVALMQGTYDSYTCRVWERPELMKEMTVDEISKALGYKVKVVGNEKADDRL